MMATTSGVQSWANRFDLLGSPARLTLLLLIQRMGPVCAADLITASGHRAGAVTQNLRLLRDHRVIATRRTGRTAHYEITDDTIADLLARVTA